VFTLDVLREENGRAIEQLQKSGASSLVKTLQIVNLQKVIIAVGMFSIFEAHLQNGLSCSNGFSEAKKILEDAGELELKECFDDFCLAINVLKHGYGRSYDALVAKKQSLSFKIKPLNESFFYEGDLAEVSILIEVNDEFVQRCGKVISDVSELIKRVRPEFKSA
jgi:hypothetical protein